MYWKQVRSQVYTRNAKENNAVLLITQNLLYRYFSQKLNQLVMMGAGVKEIEVLVGLITCQRPKLLSQLLESITSQTIFSTDIAVAVLVVDNDSEGSAASVVERYLDDFPCPVIYQVEEKKGIPYARNRVVEYAVQKKAQHIVFIDDDETAPPEWLDNLYNCIKKSGADAVKGCVKSVLPKGDIPGWAKCIKRKEWYSEDGKQIKGLSTNNVIFSTRLVNEMGLRFNEYFALTGGSDIEFFTRAAEGGSVHIVTNDATVHEYVHKSRLNLKWQFFRLYRIGAVSTYMAIKSKGYLYTFFRYFPKIILRLIAGPLLLCTAGLLHSPSRLLAVHFIGSSLGHILGFWGLLGSEYKNIHGN